MYESTGVETHFIVLLKGEGTVSAGLFSLCSHTHATPVCRSHRHHGAWMAALELRNHDT